MSWYELGRVSKVNDSKAIGKSCTLFSSHKTNQRTVVSRWVINKPYHVCIIKQNKEKKFAIAELRFYKILVNKGKGQPRTSLLPVQGYDAPHLASTRRQNVRWPPDHIRNPTTARLPLTHKNQFHPYGQGKLCPYQTWMHMKSNNLPKELIG